MLRAEGATLVFRLSIAGTSRELRVSSALATGATYHLAATYDGSTMRLFRNGTQIGSLSQTGVVDNSTSSLSLGSYPDGVGGYYNGVIDEVALYDRALTREVVGDHARIGICASPAFGNFAVGSWPKGCWRPYVATSPFNRRIPSNPTLHPRSAQIASRLNGFGALQHIQAGAPDVDDWEHPTVYSRATDPLYTIHCTIYTCTSIEGASIRIPADAKPAGGGDGSLTVIDQSGQWEYDLYEVPRGRVADNAARNAERWFGRQDAHRHDRQQWTLADVYELRGWQRCQDRTDRGLNTRPRDAGEPDQSRPVHGRLLRLGQLRPPCQPEWPLLLEPRALEHKRPADGGPFQLDPAYATENWIKGQPYWKRALLRAMRDYGMYVLDTGSGSWALRREGQTTYAAFGREDPWLTFARDRDNAGDADIDINTDDGHYVLKLRTDLDFGNGHLRVIDPCVTRGTC